MAVSRNYINNKDFYIALIEYRDKRLAAEAAGIELPRIPNYVGECFIQICSKLATKHNFSGYSYKDEFISDGIENCVMVINSFNPEKSTNPFAYFTQIIWNAFIRRISKEKKQQYIKHKNFQNTILFTGELNDNGQHIVNNEFSDGVIQNFEDKMERAIKSNAKEPVGVEKFGNE